MKDLCQPDERNFSFNINLDGLKNALSQVVISEKVPSKIVAMLEFAKKICLYAYYEYEFYSLCAIYLFLLAETAIKERFLNELPNKCELIKGKKMQCVNNNYDIIYQRLFEGWTIIGYEKVNKSLWSVLKWLKERKIVPRRISETKIDRLRQLRNATAHLTELYIYTPAIVIPNIWDIIDFVNCLFDTSVHDKEPTVFKESRKYYRDIVAEFNALVNIRRMFKNKPKTKPKNLENTGDTDKTGVKHRK